MPEGLFLELTRLTISPLGSTSPYMANGKVARCSPPSGFQYGLLVGDKLDKPCAYLVVLFQILVWGLTGAGKAPPGPEATS